MITSHKKWMVDVEWKYLIYKYLCTNYSYALLLCRKFLYIDVYYMCILIKGCGMAHVQTKQSSISINIRAKIRQRDLIDQAAKRLGRSRSDFMLEAACNKAEDVLLDQAFFSVDSNTFEKFQALLNKPLPTTDKLRRLLNKKAPWDK